MVEIQKKNHLLPLVTWLRFHTTKQFIIVLEMVASDSPTRLGKCFHSGSLYFNFIFEPQVNGYDTCSAPITDEPRSINQCDEAQGGRKRLKTFPFCSKSREVIVNSEIH